MASSSLNTPGAERSHGLALPWLCESLRRGAGLEVSFRFRSGWKAASMAVSTFFEVGVETRWYSPRADAKVCGHPACESIVSLRCEGVVGELSRLFGISQDGAWVQAVRRIAVNRTGLVGGSGVPPVPWCPDFWDSHATVMMRLFSNSIGVIQPSWL